MDSTQRNTDLRAMLGKLTSVMVSGIIYARENEVYDMVVAERNAYETRLDSFANQLALANDMLRHREALCDEYEARIVALEAAQGWVRNELEAIANIWLRAKRAYLAEAAFNGASDAELQAMELPYCFKMVGDLLRRRTQPQEANDE